MRRRKTEKGLSLIVEGGERFIPELFKGLRCIDKFGKS